MFNRSGEVAFMLMNLSGILTLRKARALNTPMSWKKSSAHMMKINIDWAFHQESHTGGWGFVLRDRT
uniref:Uncharacterized protein n=1 Tax=Arundo donax TaxID=35708 RepID=A0A0A9GR91_ARUDO